MVNVFDDTIDSLSQAIDQDVAGCKEIVHTDYANAVPCKNVGPEQKCEGCKRLLKFKRENLEG